MKYLWLVVMACAAAVALYCLAAPVFRTPPWKAALAYKRPIKKKSAGIAAGCTKWLARHISLSRFKDDEIRRELASAGIKETPKEYVAAAVFPAAVALLFAIPAYFIHPLLAVIPAMFAVYLFLHKYNSANRQCGSRRTAIEKELPRFVAYMANELQNSRNVLELIDTYKANYNTPFTEELAVTVSDMRTGDEEEALRHLETRVNSPMLGELVRGLRSAVRGNDMTVYFENLGGRMSDVWQERLKQQALKKEPKINLMSLLLFLSSILTVFIVLGVAMYSSASLLGG